MCVYVTYIMWVHSKCAYFCKEAALIVLPGASSDVDKEQVPFGSQKAARVVVEGGRGVKEWDTPLEVL